MARRFVCGAFMVFFAFDVLVLAPLVFSTFSEVIEGRHYCG
jgi:hypothetical protein